MNHWEDSRLFTAVCSGDRDAMSVLFLRYYDYLLHYGSRIGPYETIVEECIQDLFLHLFESGRRFGEVRNVKAYLFKALRRRVVEKVRAIDKQKERERLHSARSDVQFSVTDLEAEQEAKSEMHEALVQALNQLSWRQREAVYLRYYNRLSTKEIAEVMGVANQTVLNTLHQALKKIRKQNHLIRLGPR